MLLAQGRYWQISLAKGADQVVMGLQRENLPEELRELRELKIAVPLDRWNRVVKQVPVDRKLMGGVLLDFAQHKDHVSAAVGSDRLFRELQQVVTDATLALVESGALALSVVDVGAD
jgi:hypothetical protein